MSFYIGFSISSYQTEGDNSFTDWYHFEGKKLPKSGKACNLWERYEELIPILKDLNVNAFRFSIEWSRIFPEKGKIDYKSLRRYIKFTSLLIENGIEPFVTIWHFTNPKWFLDNGGWEERGNIKNFVEYADIIISNFSKIGVKHFIVFNEPLIYILSSYIIGNWPPFSKLSSIKEINKIKKILDNIHDAYKEVYNIIKEKGLKSIYTENFSGFNLPTPLNLMSKDSIINFILSSIPREVDGIGINYYGIVVDNYNRKFKVSLSYFRSILDIASKNFKEIYITENGINTEDEFERVRYIKKHLNFVIRNRRKYKISGYFIWSLMDNYEWEIGYRAKFGILTRDLNPKDSYYEIKEILSRLDLKDP